MAVKCYGAYYWRRIRRKVGAVISTDNFERHYITFKTRRDVYRKPDFLKLSILAHICAELTMAQYDEFLK